MAVIAMAKITLTRVDDGSDGADGKMLHGTCVTVAGTAAKSVTCADAASLYAGLTVLVEFTNANTASAPTLNVNSLGAKSIYINGAVVSSSNLFLWGAGAKIQFTYNGTYWIPIGHPCAYYGTSATAAATAAKTADISGIVVCKGTTVGIKFTYNNTAASPTLNVSSVGAKAVYTQGVAYAYWAAGATVSFTFDGQYWRVSSEPVYAPEANIGNSAGGHVHVDGDSVDIMNGFYQIASFSRDSNGDVNISSAYNLLFGCPNTGQLTLSGGNVVVKANEGNIELSPSSNASGKPDVVARGTFAATGAVSLNGLRFKIYETASRTFSKGKTTIADFIDIDPAQIVALVGSFYYAPSGNYYPISYPMMNDSGVYSATMGLYARLNADKSVTVVAPTDWPQTTLKLLVFYYDSDIETLL